MQCNILWSELNAVQYIVEQAKCSAIYCRVSLVKCSVNILWSEPG